MGIFFTMSPDEGNLIFFFPPCLKGMLCNLLREAPTGWQHFLRMHLTDEINSRELSESHNNLALWMNIFYLQQTSSNENNLEQSNTKDPADTGLHSGNGFERNDKALKYCTKPRDPMFLNKLLNMC